MMLSRSRLLVIGAAILIVLIVVTFPLWQPLFENVVVNEDFPGLSADAQAAFRALSTEQRGILNATATQNPSMAGTMVSAMVGTDQPAPAAESTMPSGDAAPVLLAMGSFTRVDAIHAAEGTATLYQLQDGSRLVRFENFRATNGPDLHVLLSSADVPRSHAELGADYVDLGSLKGNIGNQNYAIPDTLDLAPFSSIVIYCVPFQVVFSTATLTTLIS